MKKLFPILLLIITAQSCATDRIRYVRVKGQPREIVNNNTYTDKDSHNDPIRTESIMAVATTTHKDGVESKSEWISNPIVYQHSSNSEIITTEDIDLLDDDEPKSEKVRAALWAEDQAFRSRRNMRLSTIFLGMTLIPLIGFLFLIPSLILFIIGWTQYVSANRSRYITAKGEALLHGARMGFYAWGAYILVIILVAALVIGIYFL